MKNITRVLFFIGLFLFIFSYFIDPYIVHDGEDIVIDADVVEFLKMLYAIITIIFACSFFLFLRFFKSKTYMIFSFIFLIINLIFFCKMFLYFDKFLK